MLNSLQTQKGQELVFRLHRVATSLKNLQKVRVKNLKKKSDKSQEIYQENGQVRERSGNLKARNFQTYLCIFILGSFVFCLYSAGFSRKF